VGDTAVLSKQRTVYKRDMAALSGELHAVQPSGELCVRFQSDPGEEGNKVYLLPLDDWKDFGEPEFITVTVDPGDLLN
jgi:hypothetical protein